MFMTIGNSNLSAQDKDVLFQARISQVIFGKLVTDHMTLQNHHNADNDVEVTPVCANIDTAMPTDNAWILVAFQFGGESNAQALKRYVEDRAPALEKHGGRVFLSGVTTRANNWPYDGVEVIAFPRVESVYALMDDSDYRDRTAVSASIFSGEFAMACLTASAM